MREMVDDLGLQTEIKKALALWAESFGRKNGASFAEEIEIDSIMLHPVFYAHLFARYEWRKVHLRMEEIYEGQTFGLRSVDTLENVDRWSLQIPCPAGFKPSQSEYAIPRSERAIACPDCSGVGFGASTPCPLCNDDGTVSCSSCKGSRTEPCTTCKGKEQRTCATCNGEKSRVCLMCRGTGARNKGGACANCQGAGAEICDACDGRGTILCNICGGTRATECRNCGGKGRELCTHVTRVKKGCEVCNGVGVLKEYFAIEQFIEIIKRDCISVDESLRGFRGFYDSLSQVNPISWIRKEADQLPLNILDDTQLSLWYRKELKELNLHTEATNLGREHGAELMPRGQGIDVRYIEVCDVAFYYQGDLIQTLVRLDTGEVFVWGESESEHFTEAETSSVDSTAELGEHVALVSSSPSSKKSRRSERKARKEREKRKKARERELRAKLKTQEREQYLEDEPEGPALEVEQAPMPWSEWTAEGGILSGRVLSAAVVGVLLMYFLRGSSVMLFSTLFAKATWVQGLIYPTAITVVALLWIAFGIMLKSFLLRKRRAFLVAFGVQFVGGLCTGAICYALARLGVFFGVMWPISLLIEKLL